MRANLNKARRQAKRGDCLPCERLVQGKRHLGKKALLTRHFIALSRSQTSVFLSHRTLEVLSPGMKSIKNISNINLGFWS